MNDELPDAPLTSAARQALDTARALAERPTDEQRLRMKAALLAKVGGAALTAGTGAKLAGTAKSFSAAKLLVGLALVGGAVATVVAANHARPDESPAPVRSAPSASAPAADPAPWPAPAGSAAASIEPAAAAAPAPSASSHPAGATSASGTARDDDAFRREVDAVRSAQLHLASSEPIAALAVLQPWTGSASDPLRDERWSMQIEALCSTAKKPEGLRQRAAFLRALPSSPLASRVRGACAGADAEADSGAGF